jgi:hypothetical protein
MRDVVVCLPGITGSVLQKDGRDVWNISGGALISALTTLARSITDLNLEDDPPGVDDLGDGVTAPEVIRDVHLIPGLWKIDGYTKQLRYIEETFLSQSWSETPPVRAGNSNSSLSTRNRPAGWARSYSGWNRTRDYTAPLSSRPYRGRSATSAFGVFAAQPGFRAGIEFSAPTCSLDRSAS